MGTSWTTSKALILLLLWRWREFPSLSARAENRGSNINGLRGKCVRQPT